MRIFESFTDLKVYVASVSTPTWQTWAIPGLDPDAKLATIVVYKTASGNSTAGVRAFGATGGARFLFTLAPNDSHTVTVPVVDGKVEVRASGASAVGTTFLCVAQWGGDAVVVPSIQMGDATGYTSGNAGTWRPFDLKDAAGWTIPGGDVGNIAAVICFSQGSTTQPGPDVRASGSSWNVLTAALESAEDSIVKVDADDEIELRENGTDKSGQDSFVRFVAYIRAGSWDDGSGDFYSYVPFENPAEDGLHWQGPSPFLDVAAMKPLTSPTARAVYSRWVNLSTDPADTQVGSMHPVGWAGSGFVKRYNLRTWNSYHVDLTDDVDGEVLFRKDGSTGGGLTFSYTFGYLDKVGSIPLAPDLVAPADTETEVEDNVDLRWSDPGHGTPAGAVTVEVYLGTSPSPPLFDTVAAGGPTYTLPAGSLLPSTTYWWRVVATNAFGSTSSVTWSFTTGTVPTKATNPIPADGAVDVDPALILGFVFWTTGTGSTPITHDVYFGTDPSPPFQGNQVSNSFNPGTLAPDQTYYWRIDEVNSWGTTTGDVWSFSTPRPVCIAATPSVFARVRAIPSIAPRVAAEADASQRLAATSGTPNRVGAAPSARRRITAAPSICGEGENMKANATCPDELPWNGTAVLDLDEVVDDIDGASVPITSADSVTCSIFDIDGDVELTAVSPVTLNQVGVTNHWRNTVDVTAANGFSRRQRLRLVFTFDGGAALLGEFETLGVVGAAVN